MTLEEKEARILASIPKKYLTKKGKNPNPRGFGNRQTHQRKSGTLQSSVSSDYEKAGQKDIFVIASSHYCVGHIHFIISNKTADTEIAMATHVSKTHSRAW